jgi:hypothetical protein
MEFFDRYTLDVNKVDWAKLVSTIYNSKENKNLELLSLSELDGVDHEELIRGAMYNLKNNGVNDDDIVDLVMSVVEEYKKDFM